MFSKINVSPGFQRVLRYNENKVTNGTARLIHANGFLSNPDRLTYQEKFYRFQNQIEMNPQSKMNIVHMSLNFSRADDLTRTEKAAISDCYMARMGMKEQPYLVYEHYDTEHPHLHIVSCIVQRDGSLINLYDAIKHLPALDKEIKDQFNLASQYENEKHLPSTIFNAVQNAKEYKFSTFTEYNAILKQYGLNAYEGLPESHLNRVRGLLYIPVDDRGQKSGSPVKASYVPCQPKPTLSYLEKRFEENLPLQKENLPSIQKRIDWALSQHSQTLRDFVGELRKSDIDVVISPKQDRNGSDCVYIDTRSRTAIEGTKLGKPYEGSTILHKFDLPEQLLVPGFNPKVPQLLSHLLKQDPSLARPPLERAQGRHIDQGLGM